MSSTDAPAAAPTVRVVRATPSGHVAIPDEFRAALGIDPETPLLLTLKDGALHLQPVLRGGDGVGSPWLRQLYDYFEPWRREAEEKGYTDEQINGWSDEALAEYRRERDG